MKNIVFNKLTPSQLEVRPTDTKYKGSATLLLYIDSRSAADILNETFGAWNWQIEYKEVAGQTYGRLSIWDEDKQRWIFREDTGSESNIEGNKGQSSDILKRCVARLGCDFLYHTPKIKIDCPDSYYYNDKFSMKFSVKEIDWDSEKNCTKLVIVDKWGKVVYDLNGKGENPKYTPKKVEERKKENIDILRDFCRARIKEEGEKWRKDIENFGITYKDKANDWKGEFMVDRLYQSWVARRRAS